MPVDGAFGAALPIASGGGGGPTATDAEIKNGLENTAKEPSLQTFGDDVLGPFADAAAAMSFTGNSINTPCSRRSRSLVNNTR